MAQAVATSLLGRKDQGRAFFGCRVWVETPLGQRAGFEVSEDSHDGRSWSLTVTACAPGRAMASVPMEA